MAKKVKGSDGEEFDIEELVNRMVASKGGGDTTKTLEALVTENYELRGKNRELRQQVETGGTKVPEGARLLTPEETKTYEAYVLLGKPADLKTAIDQRDEVTTKYSDLVRDGLVRTAADTLGFKHTVLGDLAKSHNLVIEMNEVDLNGVKKTMPFVKDDKGVVTPLGDVVNTRFKDYVPALQIAAGTGQPTGTPWVPQGGGGGAPPNKGNAAADYIGKTYGAPPAK